MTLPKIGRDHPFVAHDVGWLALHQHAPEIKDDGTVDERHHRVIHPAAFFEPHEGARYDRRAVERFWPIEIGKQVRFVETVGNQRWVHVMSAVRMENVAVPAGVFRAFVVERTMQSIGPGPRPVSTYTYWYAPDAGAIVKTQVPPVDGIRIRSNTEEADVLGHPLPRPAPPPRSRSASHRQMPWHLPGHAMDMASGGAIAR